MSTIGIIRGLRSPSWKGVVRPSAQNTFAAWIASRWARPEPERRPGPQRDFRTSRRGASPGLALSTQILNAPALYSTWNFAVYLASNHSSHELSPSQQV